MKYLKGYPSDLQAKVQLLVERGQLGDVLRNRYPTSHSVRTDKALYDYVVGLKNEYIRNGAPISKVAFDSKMQVVAHTLGTHTTISRVQGMKLKTKREIRIATVFRSAPEAFLKMITVHELAHLKESEHNKAFYNLCERMEPNYHQYEFDLRLYLTHLDLPDGQGLWVNGTLKAGH
ncbi:M48 family metallopeptidase [Pusillimonas sp. ANT_WB101]|uniref:M48 family metallopeptidase n=1 Tax=Pusillimonas sp. ANT_WB101 TaxID=2597356 RepID=UPI0011EF5DEE|nr:M48 family metallopeptidase [Pusillimonas sp. ANT_WB101]KAA0910401.1 M48 family metallopeptidase [Pusillimonas sp. ANT_WB101]